MQWACIYLPHLGLDGALRERAGGRPLALVGNEGAARVLLDINDTARASGLCAGQSLTTARALLPDFDVVAHRPAADVGNLKFLAAWAYRYSSDVALLDDAIVLEVGRSLKLFGPWSRLESRLRKDLRELRFRHAVAVAPTPRAARVLAGYRDGLVANDSAALVQALDGIPLDGVRLPGKGAERLGGMGITTLGQLLSLPRAGLNRRFGKSLPAWLDVVAGEQPEVLPRYQPPDRFERRLEFDQGVEGAEALGFPLRRLIHDLGTFLSGRDGGVQRFEIGLEHAHYETTTITIGLRIAERDPEILFRLSRERFSRQKLQEAVCAIHLVARELPPFVPAIADLFDHRPDGAVPVEELRERLRARLGDDAVYYIRPAIDPRPERAQAAVASRPPVQAASTSRPRPTWLLARPVPLRGPAPLILAGPERLETGWWDSGDIRRDYYVVETSQGQRAWVFCAPGEPGCWMLHGWFA